MRCPRRSPWETGIGGAVFDALFKRGYTANPFQRGVVAVLVQPPWPSSFAKAMLRNPHGRRSHYSCEV